MERDWTASATPTDLDLVALALDDGRLITSNVSVAALQALGIGDVSGARRFLGAPPTTDARALAWCLRRIASERRGATERLARSAQLVWSGPSEGSHGLRDTRAVVEEVCSRAERRILLATYVIYDGLRSLSALARRMRERPSLEVDLYVDVKRPRRDEVDATRDAAAWMERFRSEHWPDDVRVPSIWYDPAMLDRAAGMSLHAKCVVADDRWAFVTSANFTEAAQERNIEVGVALDNPVLAHALSAQFVALREGGRFLRMPGT